MDSNDRPAQGGERVAKVMARAGLCSRREAEGWIGAGRVTVNGKVITSPALDVTPEDRIEVDGQALPQRERTRLFLYHKPRGLVTTSADPQGRPTIFQALPSGLPRLISVGRLDLASEGLLLLTNDGGVARALELPATGWLRRYRVRAHGAITQERLDKLRAGITVEGMRYGPIEATLDHAPGSANVWLTVAIREGKNREVRNVMQALGLAVNRLIRTAFGPFELGDLPEGGIDEVTTRRLREALGEDLIAKTGADFSGPMLGRTSLRTEIPPRFKPSRRERWEEKEREAKTQREEQPARAERPGRGERSGRDERSDRGARPERGERIDRGVRTERGERRDARARAPAESEAPPPRKRIGKHHSDTRVWRGGDKPLRRTFRGARRERREEDKPSGPKREELVADRKGRTVVVERFGQPKEPPPPKRKWWRAEPGGPPGDERPRSKFGRERSVDEREGGERPRGKPAGPGASGRRPPRRDRASGPRPARPK
jgi:23S rRNA pseudouridine2605 synthase